MQDSPVEVGGIEEFLGLPRILHDHEFDQIAVGELLQFICGEMRWVSVVLIY